MTKFLSSILPLALLVSSAVSLKASDVESTVTFALKYYYNPSDVIVETPTTRSITSKTVAVKNADIIASFNDKFKDTAPFPFATNAKIVRVESFSADGENSTVRYYLREKDKQADITSSFDWETTDYAYTVKYVKKTNLGVAKDVRLDDFSLTIGTGQSAYFIRGKNLGIYTFNDIFVKKTEQRATLSTISQKIAGVSGLPFSNWNIGVVDGTIKVSGPKLIQVKQEQ
jgi:hypothetical protein